MNYRVPSKTPKRIPGKLFLYSFLASISVLLAGLVIQWLVYDDWLRRTGPLRIVGTSIAAVLTFGFVLRWQLALQESRREMLRRFESISRMNDRIRNALQAIECVTYISHPHATESVKQEVEAIEKVLREVLADAGGFHSRKESSSASKDARRSA